MFTGVIESIARVISIEKDKGNLHISCKSNITSELKIDQSVAHNGVCLTVVKIYENIYTVTAIKETLEKSNLGLLQDGDQVNLERSMKLGDRLDGHVVQGHVDQKATCTKVIKEKGSWMFTFEYKPSNNITVEKGSICINGVSLTVVNSEDYSFTVSSSDDGVILGFSMTVTSIPAGSEDLLVATFENNDDDQMFDLCLSDAIFSDVYGVSVTTNLGDCAEMDFSSSLPGDLNDDGLVNVLDVVVLVNIVLGQADQDPAGDLNGDGLINVLDVVILVNIILGG